MNRDLVNRIAQAVLYEGYILYPYRPSVKNRQRWTFGGLHPQSYCQLQGNTESASMQTQCLVSGDAHQAIHGSVRFLHLMARQVTELLPRPAGGNGHPEYRFVESLKVGDRLYQSWQEAVEREVPFEEIEIADLLHRPRFHDFAFAPDRQTEVLRDDAGKCVGAILREQQEVSGSIEISAEAVADRLFKLTVRIDNQTPWEPTDPNNRDDSLMRALVSTHTVLSVRGGEFVSTLDPPAIWSGIAAGCQNVGTWPVLVGEAGARDTLLSSPIILYDYPQLAPESPGDLFDATEIDEILTLRILSLTDNEKREMAAVDQRARALLERTEMLTPQQMRNMHGTFRMAGTNGTGGHHE
jgi:hydrogenase maturation protease